jgi:predicted DNA-binding protein (UPF0251 family)
MPRPRKCRRVEYLPGVTYLKPAGIPLRELDDICLSVDEVEAIRLKDIEGLEQEKGAENMQISRATFQRILASARQKMADALLNGKAIRIEGGDFRMAQNRYKCQNGHEWDVTFEEMVATMPELCPECDTENIELMVPGRRGRRRGWR